MIVKKMPRTLNELIASYSEENNLNLSPFDIKTYCSIYAKAELKNDHKTLINLLKNNIDDKESEINSLNTQIFNITLRFIPFIEHFKNRDKIDNSSFFSYTPLANNIQKKSQKQSKIIQNIDNLFEKLKIMHKKK